MSDDKQKGKDDTAPALLQQVPISALASANAPMVGFDEAAFFGLITGGIGEIALAATRFCDTRGAEVVSERVITAHLRASLPALRTLKFAVDTTIEMLETAHQRELVGERAMAILRDAVEPELPN